VNELRLDYTDVDGRLSRIFLPMFFGFFAVWGLWFLYLLVVHPPSVVAGVVFGAIVLTLITWLFGWLALRIAVISWRSGRGTWWLRLSHSGFEVNDRIMRPRFYRWRDIDKFMLVAPSNEIEQAVLAPAISFADAAKNGDGHGPVFRVGFAYAGLRRRSILRAMFADFSGVDGTKADGLVMGYWDRPFDEAVHLMNEWHRRHRALQPGHEDV